MAASLSGLSLDGGPRNAAALASGQVVGLAAVIAVAVSFPLFASDYWLKGLLIPALVFSVAALGLNFVTGYAGLISLGQSAFMAVGAFIGVIAYGRYGIPLAISMALAGLSAALVGALVGTPSLRIKGLYLMVATLAAQFIVTWLIQRVPWFGAGSFGTVNTPPVRVAGWSIDTAAEQYYLALSVTLLLTFFARNVVRSRIGRAWIAIRDREAAAEILGISLLRYKILAFTVSSFYAGIAGALVVFAWVGAANIQEYSLDLSIQILGMTIIGGLGSLLGCFLGAAFVMLLPIAISIGMHLIYRLVGGSVISSTILANSEHLIFGALILFFLIVQPRGLAKLLSDAGGALWRRLGYAAVPTRFQAKGSAASPQQPTKREREVSS